MSPVILYMFGKWVQSSYIKNPRTGLSEVGIIRRIQPYWAAERVKPPMVDNHFFCNRIHNTGLDQIRGY